MCHAPRCRRHRRLLLEQYEGKNPWGAQSRRGVRSQVCLRWRALRVQGKEAQASDAETPACSYKSIDFLELPWGWMLASGCGRGCADGSEIEYDVENQSSGMRGRIRSTGPVRCSFRLHETTSAQLGGASIFVTGRPAAHAG